MATLSDFWLASASIAPIIGLTHYVLTRTLYGATAGLYRAVGDSLADRPDAVKLRDHLATLSNWSMAAIARIAAIAILAASMAGGIVLGVGALQTGAVRYVSERQLPDMRKPIGECRSLNRGRTGRPVRQLDLPQPALDRCGLKR
jgi:hypothetical protein